MRQLRLGTILALAGALAAFGCDDGDNGPEDAGGGGVDSGVDLMDSGPEVDSGPTPGEDAGSTDPDGGSSGGMCGNSGDCDLLAQDCPESQACRYLVMSAGETPRGLCEPAGVKLEGEACSRASEPECAEGLICFEGACREYCCGGRSTDCSVLGQFCLGLGSEAGVCVPSDDCDPVAQTGCETGEACLTLNNGGLLCTEPTSDAAAVGEPCASLNGCVAGSGCFGDPGVCRAYCDPEATDPCPSGFTCGGVAGHDGVGVCVPEGG